MNVAFIKSYILTYGPWWMIYSKDNNTRELMQVGFVLFDCFGNKNSMAFHTCNNESEVLV